MLWFVNLLLSNFALRVFVVFAFVYLVFSQSECVKSESFWVFKMYFMLRKHLLVYFGQIKKNALANECQKYFLDGKTLSFYFKCTNFVHIIK